MSTCSGVKMSVPRWRISLAMSSGWMFELVEPTSPADLRRWNPETGLLPVIEIDGERTHDSPVILDRLDSACVSVTLRAGAVLHREANA